jgi:hypothetical protein
MMEINFLRMANLNQATKAQAVRHYLRDRGLAPPLNPDAPGAAPVLEEEEEEEEE